MFPSNLIIHSAVPLTFENLPPCVRPIRTNGRFLKIFHLIDNDCHIECAACKIKGTQIVSYRNLTEQENTIHTDIFGYDENNNCMVLLTIDHILPSSWGGANIITNYRPMCYNCNSKRGNKVTDDELKEIISMPSLYVGNQIEKIKKFHSLISNMWQQNRLSYPMMRILKHPLPAQG